MKFKYEESKRIKTTLKNKTKSNWHEKELPGPSYTETFSEWDIEEKCLKVLQSSCFSFLKIMRYLVVRSNEYVCVYMHTYI